MAFRQFSLRTLFLMLLAAALVLVVARQGRGLGMGLALAAGAAGVAFAVFAGMYVLAAGFSSVGGDSSNSRG